jgi:hypothetical protein
MPPGQPLGQPPAWQCAASRAPAAHAAPPPRPAKPRLGLAVAAVVAGLIGLAASAAGLAIGVMPRHFTAAEEQKIAAWEIGNRWRSWPAGMIFPAGITYRLPAPSLAGGAGVALTAHRVGIAAAATCAQATDPAAARVLARHGCTTLLRATYTDATGAFVTTVGIAVLSQVGGAAAARTALIQPPPTPAATPGSLAPGVRTAPIAGTLTARFANSGRQVSGSVTAGPYLVMYTAGYADGRPHEAAGGAQYAASELRSASSAVAWAIASRLGAAPPPPHCPGAPGC